MRVFIAFPLPSETKQMVNKVVSDLRAAFPKLPVLWIRDENLHVTVDFLGDITESQLLKLNDIVQEEAKLTPKFEFQFGKIDCFPDFTKPEMFIIQVQEKGGEVSYDFRRHVQKKLLEHDMVPDERAWRPHITLGRFTKKTKELNVNFFENYQINGNSSWQVNRVDLFDSTLTPEGAIYENLKSYLLQG